MNCCHQCKLTSISENSYCFSSWELWESFALLSVPGMWSAFTCHHRSSCFLLHTVIPKTLIFLEEEDWLGLWHTRLLENTTLHTTVMTRVLLWCEALVPSLSTSLYIVLPTSGVWKKARNWVRDFISSVAQMVLNWVSRLDNLVHGSSQSTLDHWGCAKSWLLRLIQAFRLFTAWMWLIPCTSSWRLRRAILVSLLIKRETE